MTLTAAFNDAFLKFIIKIDLLFCVFYGQDYICALVTAHHSYYSFIYAIATKLSTVQHPPMMMAVYGGGCALRVGS